MQGKIPAAIKQPLINLRVRTRIHIRRLRASDRALPDFIIIGAQKAGTSSLFYYLNQHPNLKPSWIKETHYFAGHNRWTGKTLPYEEGIDWYRAQFPKLSDIGASDKVFEASPYYLFHPDAPARIHELLPNVKLIMLLRDPVERAISQWFHNTRRGNEVLPMLQAFKMEKERMQQKYEIGGYDTRGYGLGAYKSRGLYHEQVMRYKKYFSDEQLLILKSEKFFMDPNETVQRVFSFVGVDGTKVNDLRPRNTGLNRQAVSREIEQYLADYFEHPNARLAALLGNDFVWKKSVIS